MILKENTLGTIEETHIEEGLVIRSLVSYCTLVDSSDRSLGFNQ